MEQIFSSRFLEGTNPANFALIGHSVFCITILDCEEQARFVHYCYTPTAMSLEYVLMH